MLIEQLKTKIDVWKKNFDVLLEENRVLKAELTHSTGNSNEELDRLRSIVLAKEAEVVKLKKEINDKDEEIEVVIAQVEALLGPEQ